MRRKASPAPTYCSPRIICASRGAIARSWRCISPTRSKASSSRRPRACRRIGRPRTRTGAKSRPWRILKANRKQIGRKKNVCDQASCDQAERQQHDGARLRARGETRLHRGRRLRQDTLGGVFCQESFASDADDGGPRPAEGRGVGELRDHAVSLQQASFRPVLSDRAGKARDGGQGDVLYRRHALSVHHARDLSDARLPAISRRSRRERRRRGGEGQGAESRNRSRRRDARRVPEVLSRRQETFIGGDHVSIADIRLACSLEFLNAIDYDFPGWAKTYMSAVETALGDAYAEPAGDVEGYIGYVKGQKK